VRNIAAGNCNKLLDQRIVICQPFVQLSQHIASEQAGSSAENTQPANCGSTHFQDIYLGKAIRAAIIGQHVWVDMVELLGV
jgi:hypothetical protein